MLTREILKYIKLYETSMDFVIFVFYYIYKECGLISVIESKKYGMSIIEIITKSY